MAQAPPGLELHSDGTVSALDAAMWQQRRQRPETFGDRPLPSALEEISLFQRQLFPFALSITLDQIFGACPRTGASPANSQCSRRLTGASANPVRCETATPATRVLPKMRRELHASVPQNRDASYTCAGAGCDHRLVRYGAPAAGCRMPGCCWFRQPRHRQRSAQIRRAE